LNKPPGRSGWEKHQTNPWETGSKASVPTPDPTLVLTGTDWWWARSFVYHGVYALDSSYGAVGSGPAKYIPLGQTSPIYRELKYEWNSVAGTQGYLFSTQAQTSTTYEVVYQSGSDGCWSRYASSMGWDSYCISGFNQGHPSFQATTNTPSSDTTRNTIKGTYDTVKYKESGSYKDLSANNGGKYCSELGSTTSYKVEFITTIDANKVKTGDTAATQSCTSRDGAVYDLPG
jgi:hypothetical protein